MIKVGTRVKIIKCKSRYCWCSTGYQFLNFNRNLLGTEGVVRQIDEDKITIRMSNDSILGFSNIYHFHLQPFKLI